MAKYLYMEIKDYLLKLIKENKDVPHYQLPSENQLALRFSTTRITAKRAITELQEAGYIYRVHGKGSFITPTAASDSSLQSGNFVAMFLPNLDSQFITKMVDGVRNELLAHNFHLLVLNGKDSGQQDGHFISQLVDLGVKGMIVFPNNRARYSKDLLLLAFNKFPVVFVDRTLRDFDVSSVTSDHIDMARRAVQLLFDRGCQNVGFITRPAEYSTSISRRITGYEKAHIDNGRTILASRLLYLEKTDPVQVETISRFLEANPDMDGLLAYGGAIGQNVYRAILQAGIRVPEQMQIIFLDDEYADFSDLLPFSPTCVCQRSEEIGRKSAQLVLKYIESRNVTIDKIVVDCDIIERGSTRS